MMSPLTGLQELSGVTVATESDVSTYRFTRVVRGNGCYRV